MSYAFKEREVAVRLRNFARDKLSQSYRLRVEYPKPKLISASRTLYIGKLAANVADCQTGTLELWDQMGTSCPSEITPAKTLAVLNITGFTLKTGHFMYGQKIRYFDMYIVFPAQLQVCP